jgi:ornithine cyclodeaminase
LLIPIRAGAFSAADVVADFYEPDAFARKSAEEITLFKNGGGAHLDLMTARYILARWQAAG